MLTASIVLAAGHGKRMKSALPKILHPLLGKPMILHSLSAVTSLSDLPPAIVIGHGADAVRQVIDQAMAGRVNFVLQAEQLGTGHAVRQVEPLLRGKCARVLVTFGDMPLLTESALRQVIDLHQRSAAVVTLTSVVGDVPRGFGRVIRDDAGKVQAIVEEAVATPEQLKVREYNISAWCFDADWLWESLPKIQVSPKGEYYVTDLVAIAVAEGKMVEALRLDDPAEGLGINNRVDLADCETAMRQRVNRHWMLEGVTFLDPATTTVESDVTIGQDTVLLPGTHLKGSTAIGANCEIGPYTTLLDTTVGDHSIISYSVAEGAKIGNHVTMGPFCHLRKGAVLGDHVHLGNFGEVKDSVLHEGVKMGHFSYIGNADIGKNVNIGAGTITCNYDGQRKNSTEIGEETFIGSDTMLVAPLKIGKRATTGAGSVVTHDVPDDTTVLGVPARPRQRKENCD